jgi:hypothetical protein
VSHERASFVARVIELYLADPDTPPIPTSADWDIARDIHARGIPLRVVNLAFQLAYVRRKMRSTTDPLAPIRSLAYFRAVILNLTPEERDSAYAGYIESLYHRLRASPATSTANTPPKNRGEQPDSGASS